MLFLWALLAVGNPAQETGYGGLESVLQARWRIVIGCNRYLAVFGIESGPEAVQNSSRHIGLVKTLWLGSFCFLDAAQLFNGAA